MEMLSISGAFSPRGGETLLFETESSMFLLFFNQKAPAPGTSLSAGLCIIVTGLRYSHFRKRVPSDSPGQPTC